jgi:hypothetical protein
MGCFKNISIVGIALYPYTLCRLFSRVGNGFCLFAQQTTPFIVCHFCPLCRLFKLIMHFILLIFSFNTLFRSLFSFLVTTTQIFLFFLVIKSTIKCWRNLLLIQLKGELTHDHNKTFGSMQH